MRTPIMSPIRRVRPASVRPLTHQPGDNLRGATIMTLCMVAFGLNDTVMKFVAQNLPLYQAVTLRGLFVMIAIGAVSPRLGGLHLRIPRDARRPMIWRSIGEIASTLLFLNALQHMAMGNLSAIMQALPLVVMVAAALFFGEALGWRRVGAVVAGFLGVLLILRPGATSSTSGPSSPWLQWAWSHYATLPPGASAATSPRPRSPFTPRRR
ncbi:DMT family transporter [Paracoccus aerius]